MTRAEELAKIRSECREWPQALHLINDLVADTEALAEALEPFLRGSGPNRKPSPPTWETAGQHVVWLNKGEWEQARAALARYRGEK